MELIRIIDMNFTYKNYPIRVLGTFEEPLFIAKEICIILGLSNPTIVLRNLPDRWKRKMKIETKGGMQDTNLITEPGLYRIIMRSNKPVALLFQEWICEDVLPNIRKTGQYKMNEEYMQMLEKQNKIIKHKDGLIRELQYTVFLRDNNDYYYC